MNVLEIFQPGDPVYLIVQNRLCEGYVARTICDGLRVEVAVSREKNVRPLWVVPVDRVATRKVG